MGLAATFSRYQGLSAKKTELEFTMEQIAQTRQALANEQLNMINLTTTLEPESDEARDLQNKILRSHQQDKFLDLQMLRTSSQHNMVQTEIESLKKILEKSVENVFKPFG